MPVHGIINVNKPPNLTSRQVVDRVKRILKMRKAGHAGTLDPNATGVLLVCLGDATKLFQYLQEGEKEYEATLTLGIETDTLDSDGNVTRIIDPKEVTEEQIANVFNKFLGEIEQIPPMFSAVKVGGKRLYELARKGITIERPPRKVTIYELEVLEINNLFSSRNCENFGQPLVKFRAVCSKGTYIRTLAADIGTALGCGAHLSALTRTKSGTFNLSDAVTLAEIENCPEKAYQAVHSIEEVLSMLSC